VLPAIEPIAKGALVRFWRKAAERLLLAVGSTDRGNTLGELLRWRLIEQGLSRTLVELLAMALSLAWLCTARSVPRGRYWRSNRLVFSFEPRCQGGSWIAEVDLDVRGQLQSLVIGKLLATIPGQRLIEFAGEVLRVLDQGGDNAFGVLVGDLDQHEGAGMALDQRRHIAVLGPTDEVAFQ